MTAAVTVVGEALIDIVIPPAGPTVEHVGGSPANVAVGLARLGHPTSLATHVGTDARGRRIAAVLEAEHVALAPGSTTAERTPTATARLDETGAATYDFDLEWRLDADLTVPSGAHLHTGSIAAVLAPGATAVATILETARARATISYDPNVRPSLMGDAATARAAIEHLVSLADVVKASDEDLQWLYPDAEVEDVLRRWAALGPRVLAVTRGGKNVAVLVGGELHQLPVRVVEVVDTVGAGDSFMAGLLSGLLDAGLLGDAAARARLVAAGWSELFPAVVRAIESAAITVSRAGANPPTREELGLAPASH